MNDAYEHLNVKRIGPPLFQISYLSIRLTFSLCKLGKCVRFQSEGKAIFHFNSFVL